MNEYVISRRQNGDMLPIRTGKFKYAGRLDRLSLFNLLELVGQLNNNKAIVLKKLDPFTI